MSDPTTLETPRTTESAPSTRRRPRLARRDLVVAVVILLAAALLTCLYGYAPGFVRSLPEYYWAVGRVDCGALSLAALAQFTCPLVGGDAGGLFQSNVSVTIGAVVLARLGVDAAAAVGLVSYVLVALGLWGGYRIIRELGVGRPIALGAAFLFFASTSMMGFLGFGGLVVGLLAGFFAVAVEILGLRAVRDGRRGRAIVALVAFAAASVVVVFSDGYAFMMFVALSGVVGLFWGVPGRRRPSTWAAVAGYVGSIGLAYGLFSLVPRSGEWTKSAIELFRAMSLDPATLAIPSKDLWWADALGVTVRSDLLWGDGTNSAFNYLGFAALALAVVGIVLRPRRGGWLFAAIGVVAVLALVLALGPSLKWYAIRGELEVPVTYESYLMPAEAALFDLPTRWLYEHAPGFEFMRATYRWVILLRFGVLALAAVGATALLRRWKGIAIVALVVATAELAIDIPGQLADATTRAGWATAFDRDVVEPLDADLDDGARVLFSPNAVGENDFAVNYLAVEADLWTFNVGNDKALERARTMWPAPVAELLAADNEPLDAAALDTAMRVLADGHAEAIVVPFFDLRWSSYTWPAASEYVERGEAAADAYADDSRFDVSRSDTYAVVTLRDPRP